VPIKVDAQDATISAPIVLNDGVQVRFGGRAMVIGDYWNFSARFLAGDELSGLNPVTRLEQLRFARPRGVIHHYAPLAVITRDGSDSKPAQIANIQDRRQRTGSSSTTQGNLPTLNVAGSALTYMGGVSIPPVAAGSTFLIYWSADLFMPTAPVVNTVVRVQVVLFSDAMKNPATDQQSGVVRQQTAEISLARRPVSIDVPVTHLFVDKEDSSAFANPTLRPTSVQIFVTLSAVAGFTLQLTNAQVTVIEMKKGF
jgi:hypothetical protein